MISLDAIGRGGTGFHDAQLAETMAFLEDDTRSRLTLPRQTGLGDKFEHHLEESHDAEDAEAAHGRVQSHGGCPAE
jgi:hypothetical protein